MSKKVFIDAGHGGKDPGAIGNGMREKDITLSVALKTGRILREHGVKVEFSRTTDVFLELPEIVNKANRSNADAFVSYHANSFSDSAAKGIEIFSNPGSPQGPRLARDILNAIKEDNLYTVDRGLKQRGFYVIRNTRMTSVLVELAFISNREDAAILRDKQNELAIASAKGILRFLGVKYIPTKNDKGVGNVSEKRVREIVREELKGSKVSPVWAKEAINYVQKEKIMVGDTQGNFNANQPVTRAELAQVLLNLSKK